MNPLDRTISELPEHMQESVRQYIYNGAHLGGFLERVFENDLMRAACHADSVNINSLHLYATLLYNAPIGCSGSIENIREWQKIGGLDGLGVAHD